MKFTSNHWHPAVFLTVSVFLTFATLAGPPKKPAPDLLQISIHERMANEGALAGASGKVDLHLDQHGKDNHQDLHLHLEGLDTNSTYTLAAQTANDTNFTEVLSFTPDQEGKADLHLRDKGPTHPHDHAGHVDGELPAQLEPLTVVQQFVIADTNATAILVADLAAPDNFDYHLKRDLGTNNIVARLDIHANGHEARLHLDAKGLDAGAQYSLAVNGNVVGSASAHPDGHLDLHAELQNPVDVFALSSIALLDASSNVVVSTTFP